jgi:alkanesulfonate monooxygenase SsuD/methylene tetrahydromethanopterin reductase-like flavin-dependent oxidoreductase (luciferase family)
MLCVREGRFWKSREEMPKPAVFVLAAFATALPVLAAAQDENVNCAQFLAMDAAAQVAAIDAAMEQTQERGMGRHFAEDATDEEKLNYTISACNDPDGTLMVDLVDMLGE